MPKAAYFAKVVYSPIAFVKPDLNPVNITPRSLQCELVESLVKS